MKGLLSRPLIAANWKMHKTIGESVDFADRLKLQLADVTLKADVVVAPPFTALRAVADALGGSNIGIAAQNLHDQAAGAYTGEISAPMLIDAGCRYVIIGHSERRTHFSEGNDLINRKVRTALLFKMIPILCVGETLRERESGWAFDVIEKQINEGLLNVGADDIESPIIAYEPVWAIGTGQTATPDQAEKAHAHIRRMIRSVYGSDRAENMRIIYGGSVNPDNMTGLMAQLNINGALVGGAGLQVESFVRIVRHGD